MSQYMALALLVLASLLSLITVPLFDLLFALYEAAWKRHTALGVLALFPTVVISLGTLSLPLGLIFTQVFILSDIYGLMHDMAIFSSLGLYLAQWVLIAWGYELMKRPCIKRFLPA